jgi:hypothetical protein
MTIFYGNLKELFSGIVPKDAESKSLLNRLQMICHSNATRTVGMGISGNVEVIQEIRMVFEKLKSLQPSDAIPQIETLLEQMERIVGLPTNMD